MEWIQSNVDWVFSGVGHWIIGGIISILIFFFYKKKKNGVKADNGSAAFGDNARYNNVNVVTNNINTKEGK